MEVAITFGVVLVLITVGAVVILRLQHQRAERTATFTYSRPLPGRRSGPPHMTPPAGQGVPSAAPSEGRGRPSPR